MDGEEVRIGIDSSTRIKGTLYSGSWARVKAVLEDGALLAREVKIEETEDGDEDSGGGNGEDEDEDGDKGKGKGRGKE